MTGPWLGHENWCSVQWSTICGCGAEDVDLADVDLMEPHCSAPFRFDLDQPGCQDDACPKHGGREDEPVDLSETPPEPAWMTTLSGDGDLG